MNKMMQEAEAFDIQIMERWENGHYPDLRRTKPCDYFYNNSWRRPEYVKLDMGDQFDEILMSIKKFTSGNPSDIRILEIGCGPGHFSLELARNGYNVFGIDISKKCIEIARHVANEDPWIETRGTLRFETMDMFCEALETETYQVVLFVGALHHFADQEKVLNRVASLMRTGGILIAHEPTRDRVSRKNTILSNLIQVLLATNGGYFKEIPIPGSPDEFDKQISELMLGLKYEDQMGEKVQSVNDNEAGHKEMWEHLSHIFEVLEYKERSAIFHELIGGLRFSEEKNTQLGKFIRLIDQALLNEGALNSTEFLFVGRKN